MFFTHLVMATCFIKHIGFLEENEIRIVDSRTNEVKSKFSNGLYSPYIELDFNNEISSMICEIWIGPAARQELVKRSIELILHEFRMQDKCETFTSEIPYRLLKNDY